MIKFCSLSADPCHRVAENLRTGRLLLQELKGTEFPFEAFKSLGYERV